jgi:hypothetical protein
MAAYERVANKVHWIGILQNSEKDQAADRLITGDIGKFMLKLPKTLTLQEICSGTTGTNREHPDHNPRARQM